MMHTQSGYFLSYKNGLCFSSGESTLSGASSKGSDNLSDIADAEYVDRNIPRMELLKINYVNKVRGGEKAAVEVRKRRERQRTTGRTFDGVSSGVKRNDLLPPENYAENLPHHQSHRQPHPLKYTVYKSAMGNERENDLFKTKRKYSIFDGKKKRNADTNIQFYFDSKSYERHVDNKYARVEDFHRSDESDSGHGDDSMIEKPSNSWHFRKNPKKMVNNRQSAEVTRNVWKKVPFARNLSRDSSLVDVPKVTSVIDRNKWRSVSSESIVPASGNIDATAGSLKKVKKLIDDFDNRCLCDATKVDKVKVKRQSMEEIYSVPNAQNKAITQKIKMMFEASSEPKKPVEGPVSVTVACQPVAASPKWLEDEAAIEKAINNISITRISTVSNKSKLYLKTKDFDDDDLPLAQNNFNFLKNCQSTTNLVDGSQQTSIPIKFVPNNQNLNNSMKCKSVEKLDFKSTTAETQKMNRHISPADTKMDGNRVKIFIKNPMPDSESEQSDFYDTPASEKSMTIQQTEVASPPKLQSLFPTRMGCDGAIFWNDCYYYDEHPCCSCKGDADGTAMNQPCFCDEPDDDYDCFNDDEDDDDEDDAGVDVEDLKQVLQIGKIAGTNTKLS